MGVSDRNANFVLFVHHFRNTVTLSYRNGHGISNLHTVCMVHSHGFGFVVFVSHRQSFGHTYG